MRALERRPTVFSPCVLAVASFGLTLQRPFMMAVSFSATMGLYFPGEIVMATSVKGCHRPRVGGGVSAHASRGDNRNSNGKHLSDSPSKARPCDILCRATKVGVVPTSFPTDAQQDAVHMLVWSVFLLSPCAGDSFGLLGRDIRARNPSLPIAVPCVPVEGQHTSL